MTPTTWLLHDTPSKRFPLYTRSNAAEVMGAPVSPLGWSYVWRGAFGPGTVRGYVEFGGFEETEFDGPEDVYGVFGGYFLLNISPILIQMERLMTGGAAATAAMFDGGPGMPPFRAELWHSNSSCRDQLSKNIARFMRGEVHTDLNVLHHIAIAMRADRPDFENAPPSELISRMRAITPLIERAGCIHVQIGQMGMIAHAQLSTIMDEVGRRDDVARLGTGIGDVESADIACHLWTISRLVRRSTELTAAFRLGANGVLDRIHYPEFKAQFDAFIYNHGSRATNEWDLIYNTFETRPELALALIESMAKQDDDADPVAALKRNTQLRIECLADIRKKHPDHADAVDATANALAIWFAARERSKNMCVRIVHEARMCCEAMAERAVRSGDLCDTKHFYMLLTDELDGWADDPASFRETLANRYCDYLEIAKLEPPFFVDGSCPPIHEWKQREIRELETAKVGESLKGFGCSPGRITGKARIILDPSDPGALEPDEILVTTTTNPSWTPLFLVAGAVVTEFGLFNSHASIVSRELGIPCVASVEGATDRIRDGALLCVDGTAGTVEILAEAA